MKGCIRLHVELGNRLKRCAKWGKVSSMQVVLTHQHLTRFPPKVSSPISCVDFQQRPPLLVQQDRPNQRLEFRVQEYEGYDRIPRQARHENAEPITKQLRREVPFQGVHPFTATCLHFHESYLQQGLEFLLLKCLPRGRIDVLEIVYRDLRQQ